MEKLLFNCRVEKKVTPHGLFTDKVNLGEGKELAQCLSCGVMGVVDRKDASGDV